MKIRIVNIIHIFSFLFIISSNEIYANEESIIDGVLTWKEGFGIVTDCKAGDKHKIGVMASAPYFKLRRNSQDIIEEGGSVHVRIKGVINKKSKLENQFTIHQPEVLNMKRGDCGN